MLQTETMGERLKKLREKKGLNQDDLAQELNVTRATIANYEKNRRSPDADTIIFLADYYNVPCDYLLRGVKSELTEIHSYTGLSDKAIENLHLNYLYYINSPQQGSFEPDGNLNYLFPFEFINYFLEETIESDIFKNTIRFLNIDSRKYSINTDDPYYYFCSHYNEETSNNGIDINRNINPDIIDLILNDAAIIFGDKYKSFLLEELTNQFRNYMLECKSNFENADSKGKDYKTSFYFYPQNH